MFDIDIQIDDINISSIEKEDIIEIQKWINIQQFSSKELSKPLNLREFYERFLEYYVSESEFFLKINKGDKLIGVLKGRIEFKNPNEVWLWYFMIDNELRGMGLGSSIINKITSFFLEGFGINTFFTGVANDDARILRFWKKNKFQILRVSKDFFNINGKEIDMIVMKSTL